MARPSLFAHDPVTAEKHHGNEKAYLDKVMGSHSRAPARTISESLLITAVWPSWGGKPARSSSPRVRALPRVALLPEVPLWADPLMLELLHASGDGLCQLSPVGSVPCSCQSRVECAHHRPVAFPAALPGPAWHRMPKDACYRGARKRFNAERICRSH